MRKFFLLLALSICLQASGAVKGNGTSGLIIFGNGSSGCATCLTAPSSYSVTFWYKAPSAPSNTADSEQVVYFNDETGANAQIEFIWSYPGNPLVYDVCTHSPVFPLTNISPVSGLTWYAIACTWDGSNIRSYKNGVLINTGVAGSITSGAILMQTLGSFASNSHYAPGTVAEITYYHNATLVLNEIKGIAAGFTPGRIHKPTIYAPMWGTALSSGNEPDLSGGLAQGRPSTGTCYTNVVFSSTCTGVSLANHAPVMPFSGEEEGAQ